MGDNEIVKALESVAEWFTEHGRNTNTAVIGISKQAINLINRQKAEIEELEISIFQFISAINAYKAEIEQWQGGYMTQKQEIANLEIELKAMRGAANSYKAENARLKKGWKADVILTPNVKAEAYREFAERVKICLQGDIRYDNKILFECDIDNILKELVGEGGQLGASVPTSKKEDCK